MLSLSQGGGELRREEVRSRPTGARVRGEAGRLWFSLYGRQAFLESREGLCLLAGLAEWFGALSKLCFVAGFTRGKSLIPMEGLGKPNDRFPG